MKTALIVEDTPYYSQILAEQLQQLGLKAIQVRNGQEALTFLKRKTVDVVFLDNFMPVMSGLELLDALSREVKDFTTPVIMMSTTQSINRIAVAEKGAWDWVDKPTHLSEIRAVLKRVRVI